MAGAGVVAEGRGDAPRLGLQTRRTWTGDELADRLGVTLRTIRRDIDRLRTLGYPVEGTTGTAGGYRLAAGADLPPLLLDDDEAVAIAVPLRTAAAGVAGIEETAVRALAKPEQVLPIRLRHQVATIQAAASPLPVPWSTGPRADPSTLALLAAACRDHEVVTFTYRRGSGETGPRRVEPCALVAAGNAQRIAEQLLGIDLGPTDTIHGTPGLAPPPSGEGGTAPAACRPSPHSARRESQQRRGQQQQRRGPVSTGPGAAGGWAGRTISWTAWASWAEAPR
ncbi:helix-turn-helix transcriptional regulator [Streptomyces sp. NPDC054866]